MAGSYCDAVKGDCFLNGLRRWEQDTAQGK
jgi:hypothetical protein